MSEFRLIDDYFNWGTHKPGIKLGIGDDAAILTPQPEQDLVIAMDTSISGRHFPADTPATDIGYKALAVNLSDLAAMGATPAWFTLALTLPDYDPHWLAAFSRGMRELAKAFDIPLIGGDTTRGALSITIQVAGTVPAGMALLRSGAQSGDIICVSGHPGDAAAGLDTLQGKLSASEDDQRHLQQRLNRPTPQLALGQLLLSQANSCMDISDGLLADLGHILQRSDKGAQINTDSLPFSPALYKLPRQQREAYALQGGDDYELLFTLGPDKFTAIREQAASLGVLVSAIGSITDKANELLIDKQPAGEVSGYNHFQSRG